MVWMKEAPSDLASCLDCYLAGDDCDVGKLETEGLNEGSLLGLLFGGY